MRTAARCAAAAAVLAALAPAAVPGRPPIDVVFPFGEVVRPGRPFVVRAPGAAAVRADGGPWAVAGGDEGDEFLLLPPAAVARSVELTIRAHGDEDLPAGVGGPEGRRVEVRVLPAPGPVRAVFDARDVRTPSDVLVTVATLPTLPEAWLLFDEVPAAPAGASPAAIRAMERARELPHPGDPARAPFQPWTSGPDPGAYRALAVAADATPPLPRDVAAALCVLAAAEVLLLLVLRRRRPWVRAAWLAAPPLAALAGLAAAGRATPVPIRAVAVRIEGPSDALVVVRLAGPRSGPAATGSFEVPRGAASPAVVAYDADDTGAGATVRGRTVEVALAKGASRVVAWREPPLPPGDGVGRDGSSEPSAEVLAWIRARGLDVLPGSSAAGPPTAVSDGIRLVALPPIRVAARK